MLSFSACECTYSFGCGFVLIYGGVCLYHVCQCVYVVSAVDLKNIIYKIPLPLRVHVCRLISTFRVEVNMYLAGVFCVRARVSRLYIWGVCRVAPLCICKVDADS